MFVCAIIKALSFVINRHYIQRRLTTALLQMTYIIHKYIYELYIISSVSHLKDG